MKYPIRTPLLNGQTFNATIRYMRQGCSPPCCDKPVSAFLENVGNRKAQGKAPILWSGYLATSMHQAALLAFLASLILALHDDVSTAVAVSSEAARRPSPFQALKNRKANLQNRLFSLPVQT